MKLAPLARRNMLGNVAPGQEEMLSSQLHSHNIACTTLVLLQFMGIVRQVTRL